MATRFAVSALAAAGYAAAQCSVSGTTTIQNGGDATALAACQTFSGSIAIATDAANSIQLNGIQTITGDLTATNNSVMYSIGGDSLSTIGGAFNLNTISNLASVTMPRLQQVRSLAFAGLPNLQTLGFTSGLSQAGSLDIQNTFLTTLSGINLQSVNSINLVSNPLLQDMSFQVSRVSGSITIISNGDRLQVAFPNLQTAQNLTVSNAAALSIPSLANVTGNLYLRLSGINSIMTPNLTLVQQTLEISSNPQLTNVSMPQLKTIGAALNVLNNTQLTEFTLPALTTVGSINMTGAFNSVKLPALKDDKGAFSLISSGNVTSDCNNFKSISGSNNVIKGKFQACQSNADQATVASGTTGGSTSSTPKSDSGRLEVSSNAAIGIGSVIIAMFGLL